MQDSNGKRFGALVTTIPLLILAIVMLGAPSASALVPSHGFLRNHHSSFAPRRIHHYYHIMDYQ